MKKNTKMCLKYIYFVVSILKKKTNPAHYAKGIKIFINDVSVAWPSSGI